MIVAATPIDPPEGDLCWRFHFVNDSDEPIESVVVESVDYEWGDSGNGRRVGTRFGPIPARTSLEIFKETDTEVRTSLTLRVRGPGGEQSVVAEFGRLYRLSGVLAPIPILDRPGKRATLEIRRPPPGTVEIDGVGARRWLGDGRCESIRWDELVKVELLTTDAGPAADDVFWVLHGADGKGCVLPSDAGGPGALLERLQRLPGFDHAAVIQAMSSAADARFPVWERPPGVA